MSTLEKVGVGVVGANSKKSWAAEAHIPALRGLPDRYEITALSTTRQETADEAARTFHVANAFDSHTKLIAHPDVDLVVVTVKVAEHSKIVEAALRAGKAVYCEWPLGNGLAESEQMAKLAQDEGVLAAIGLQGRAAPVVRRVRDLITEGFAGKVHSTSIIASGGNWGEIVSRAGSYIADRANGATMLEINLGHTADALCWCLGEFQELSSYIETLTGTIRLLETGEEIPKTAPDQITVTGILTSGVVASIHYRGGISQATNFHWEINGSEGDLVVTLDDPLGSLDSLKLLGSVGSIQLGELKLAGARGGDKLAEIPIPASYAVVPDAPGGLPFNLTQAYAMLADDLRDRTTHPLTPTFDDALVRHRMMDAIERAAQTGTRTTYL
jgi:predicted dehydrogenase